MKNPKIFAVSHPQTGAMFTPNADNTHVKVRVESTVVEITNGYMNPRKRTAFITVKEEFLSEFCSAAGLNPNAASTADAEGNFPALKVPFKLEGQIQVQESFEPFWEGQDPKINPSSGEVILKEGKEVYRQTQFVTDSSAPSYLWVEGEASENEGLEPSTAFTDDEATA